MFTGIISDVGVVEKVEAGTNLHRLRIACSYHGGNDRNRARRLPAADLA